MRIDELRYIIKDELRKLIEEGWYTNTATPHFSKTDVYRELGINPLMVDNGKHTSNDVLRQVSTVDYNGANFKGETVVLSDNKFMIYRIKNFNNDRVTSTMSLFGSDKELRRAIDTLNGAATRNGKSVSYRIIKAESNKSHSQMKDSFWEFSYDHGNTWYILKPNPVQNMKQSKLIKK